MSIFKKVAVTAIMTVSVILFTGCISTGTDPNLPPDKQDQTTDLSDIDGDKTPDVIDNDIDNDGIPNNQDTDIDGDKIPNTQDNDIDGDGNDNIDDNDIDGDGIVNDNDSDIDGDGKPNTQDNDIDGDGIINIDDNDIDGDGITNDKDTDIDGDGITNDKDTDIDGDSITNDNDIDIDGDGIINTQDNDIDGDGTPNTSDTTPGGNTTTTTNGTQGDSNTGADQNTGTTNTGTDNNSGSTSDDVTGVAITVIDTIDYTLKIDAGSFNGSVTQKELLKLDDLRKEITDAGVVLQSFSFLDMKVTGSASSAFLQQNAGKKIILNVFYTDASGAKIKIFESSPSSDLAPLLTLNDLSKGINLNDQIRVSVPGFPNFIAMIKDPSISQLQTGAEIVFVDPITASNADINLTCALKISGVAKL